MNTEIERGRRLVEALDSDGYDVAAAFWFYEPNAERWRFKIAPRRSKPINTQDELARIARVNSRLGDSKVDIGSVELVEVGAPLIQVLGRMTRVEGLSDVRLRRSSFNGIYIDDALIYRMAP